MRRDLEFFPIQQGDQRFILIRDHLGLVGEGKAISIPLFQLMTMLDGRADIRDIQMQFMRQKGGVLVDGDQIKRIINDLDQSYLLESERFKNTKKRIVEDFISRKVRSSSHSGVSYPAHREQLKQRLDEILNLSPCSRPDKERVISVVAPHIDLNVGARLYSCSYNAIRHIRPGRVIILGVGHHLMDGLFSITTKDFETPFGIVKNDTDITTQLKEIKSSVIAKDDFAHRSEHSIEFQIIFLQHIFPQDSFRIVPVLCGSARVHLSRYCREAYIQEAGEFIDRLKNIVNQDNNTLIVAGVDMSHTGPKFGHSLPALQMESRFSAHDRRLLECARNCDKDGFWEESVRVNDEFNVCGFSALACLLEILPPSEGKVLDYEIWHESATNSAVSFASMIFTKLIK